MLEKFPNSKKTESIISGKSEIRYKYPPSERGLKEYTEQFNLDLDELRGKKVLDIGASFNFQRQAKEEGIDVIALDAFGRKDANKENKAFVVGTGQFLPFNDNSFDVVLANNSVPLHLKREDNIGALSAIYEMLRVANINGKVKITPFTPAKVFEKEGGIILSNPEIHPKNQFLDINLKEILEESNISYKVNDRKDIERWLSPDYLKYNLGNPDWYKDSGAQFIEMHKTENFNSEPFLREIKRLVNKKLQETNQ